MQYEKPPYNRDYTMSSMQITALIYFTVIVIGAWIFFGVIFLQLKRFLTLSSRVPLVSKILTVVLISLTVLGYLMVFLPDLFGVDLSPTTNTRPSGNFDTY